MSLFTNKLQKVQRSMLEQSVQDDLTSLAQNENKTSAFVNINQYQNLVVSKTSSSGTIYDDWYNAIQTAINNNDKIELPSGTFCISQPIVVSDYKILQGNGRKTVIQAKETMNSVLSVANYANSISYALIENFYVDGNNLATYGVKTIGFTNNSCMRNMWIEHCIDSGLYVTKAWYCSFEKMMIRNCANGITVKATGADSVNQTGNVNCVNFDDIYIAFMTNIGINITNDSGYGNMISNSTIEQCASHGIYIHSILSPVTCLNVYMESISGNGYQVDQGGSLNIMGGYITVAGPPSRCVQVGNISKLLIHGTCMNSPNATPLDYMVYSTATLNEIYMMPISSVSKRTIYYTGKFRGAIENVISGNGTDFGYDMDSLTTRKLNLTSSTSYGVDTNIEIYKGSSTKASVDAGRVYQYYEKTNTNSGYGNQISFYGNVNDLSNTQKQVYGINNAFFVAYRFQLANYATSARPTEYMTGSTIYDTTVKKPIVWNGSAWVDYNNVAPENKGINVAVSASATNLTVTFPTTETDANYGVNITPSWNTTYWITGKTTTGFTINFGTAPVSATTLDWSIKR